MSTRSAPRHTRLGSARDRVADVLVRVETDGAFAAPALDAALDREPALSRPDRGLATELTYGVLRTAGALDARLDRMSSRAGSMRKLDAYARAVLRIAAYEILALERVPPRASVNAAVGALERARSAGLAGFANAVLRKLAAERPPTLDVGARTALALESTPKEVRATIAAALGSDADALAVLRAMFDAAHDTPLRVNAMRGDVDSLLVALRTESPDGRFERGRISPWALRASGAGDLPRTRAWREGLFAVQEEGAQCAVLASGARAGASVLDACAGRGGKTGALASMMRGRGVLHAAELHPDRLARIDDELARLGVRLPGLEFASAPVDLARGLGDLARIAPRDGYDIVLVDAPCSGLGTLARRPDILGRRAAIVHADDAVVPGDTARVALPVLQRAILDRVAPLVRNGGTLLYAVCTLSCAEGRDVIDAFRAEHPQFAPCDAHDGVPERLRPWAVTLRPDIDGTDGFMLFRLRRDARA